MNRMEVIMTIKKVGAEFSRIRAALNSRDFTCGYNTAIGDMAKLFEGAKIAPDFDAEREAMLAHIKALTKENEMLKVECGKNHETIEELMKHVDIHEVLGIGANSRKREAPKAKRRVAFVFE